MCVDGTSDQWCMYKTRAEFKGNNTFVNPRYFKVNVSRRNTQGFVISRTDMLGK